MSNEASVRTVREMLDAATRRLSFRGIEAPRREAIDLWCAVTGLTPLEVLLDQDRQADPQCSRTLRGLVRQRLQGRPRQYVIGRAGFRLLDLQVDERVLIPRPETETLVDVALAITNGGSGMRALDIGTGSGCIALSLALEGRFDEVVATDVSPRVVEVARSNLESHDISTPVRLLTGGLYGPVAGELFDIIVSNPPYIARCEYDDLDPSVRFYEPELALVSGEDGLSHARLLLRDGSKFLRPGGSMIIEVDATRGADTLLVAEQAGWKDCRIEKDLFGRDRVLVCRH